MVIQYLSIWRPVATMVIQYLSIWRLVATMVIQYLTQYLKASSLYGDSLSDAVSESQ
jgi:hypothetical protein